MKREQLDTLLNNSLATLTTALELVEEMKTTTSPVERLPLAPEDERRIRLSILEAKGSITRALERNI